MRRAPFLFVGIAAPAVIAAVLCAVFAALGPASVRFAVHFVLVRVVVLVLVFHNNISFFNKKLPSSPKKREVV